MNTTRNLILSALVLVWGLAMLLRSLASGGPEGGGSYGAGQTVALVLAAAMVVLGGRGVYRALGNR